jgi:hypothetical protein
MTVLIQEHFDQPPSEAALHGLDALRIAVARALDRKRRLGQYAVIWQGGRVVKIAPEDLPAIPDNPIGVSAWTSATNQQAVLAQEPPTEY